MDAYAIWKKQKKAMFVENVTYSNGSPQYVYFTECNADVNGVHNAGSDSSVK